MQSDRILIKPKGPKGEDGYKIFSIRIEEEIVQALDDIATKTGRSRNELIRLFLKFALERCDVAE